MAAKVLTGVRALSAIGGSLRISYTLNIPAGHSEVATEYSQGRRDTYLYCTAVCRHIKEAEDSR